LLRHIQARNLATGTLTYKRVNRQKTNSNVATRMMTTVHSTDRDFQNAKTIILAPNELAPASHLLCVEQSLEVGDDKRDLIAGGAAGDGLQVGQILDLQDPVVVEPTANHRAADKAQEVDLRAVEKNSALE